MLVHNRTVLPALSLLLSIAMSSAQTYSSCNPLKQDSCPADPALGQSVSIDFTNGASSQFTTTGSPSYGPDGAEFTVAQQGDSPTVISSWYIMFGHVEFVIKAAPGQGIVSSAVLQSDCLDEIDWEWLGGNNDQVQSNYFGKGITVSYNRGAFHGDENNHDEFHTYSIDWTADQIVWAIDGQTVRVLPQTEAETGQYPQTPMQVKVGVWAGGDSSNEQGTINWAGGLVDYSSGPFTMYLKSISVQDYSTGSSYSYSGTSGTWESIESDGGKINGGSSGSNSNSVVSTVAASAASTVTSAVSNDAPLAFGAGESSETVTRTGWPWDASATVGIATSLASSTEAYTLPSAGRTVFLSPSGPAASSPASSLASGLELSTLFDDRGFPTVVTINPALPTHPKSYDDQGFLITSVASTTPPAASGYVVSSTFQSSTLTRSGDGAPTAVSLASTETTGSNEEDTERNSNLGTKLGLKETQQESGPRSETDVLEVSFDDPSPTPVPASSAYPLPPACITSPFSWTSRRKFCTTCLSCAATLVSGYSSGSNNAAGPGMSSAWHVSETILLLGTTTFCLGFAMAPMFLSPFSEINGRKPVFLFSGIVLALSQLGSAVADSLPGLLVARFFTGVGGSTFSTMVGGVVADMYTAEDRNTAMTIFAGAAFFGTGLGPLVSGLIAYHMSWRWVFYVQAISCGTVAAASIFLFEETRENALLAKQAKALNKWFFKCKQLGMQGVRITTIGITTTFLVIANYTADTYHYIASSALAAESLSRNILAGVFPLATEAMFRQMTNAGALSFLAGVDDPTMAAPAAVPDVTRTHPYTCNSCLVAFRESDAQRTHMRGDWHKYNLKRRVAELPPLSADDFQSKVKAVQAANKAAADEAAFSQTCPTCHKAYFSKNAYDNHIQSKSHKTKELALARSGHGSVTGSSTTEDLLSAETETETTAEIKQITAGVKNARLAEEASVSSPMPSARSGDTSQEALSSLPQEVDPLSVCLFCNYTSPTWKLSVDHMSRIHGLFIPEQSYIVDLRGLLTYLRAKIQENSECLWCHKLKGNAEGVQTHMRDKGHCRIAFETEEEMIEVGQFYDFSSTYSDLEDEDDSDIEIDCSQSRTQGGVKVNDQGGGRDEEDEDWETDSSFSSVDTAELAGVPNDDRTHSYERLHLHRHHSQTDQRPHKNVDGYHSHAHTHANAVFYDDYEMHLPSGRVAGHRSLKKYYRQNLHSYPSAAERMARAQRLIEEGSEGEESVDLGPTPATPPKSSALIRRTEAGMIGASAQQRKDVRSQEIRGRRQAAREQRRYQAKLEKQANSQKHFRDPLLQ
ncbi:hypothetical protein DV738_g5308, partial [Chaetothyriales sp. CBS 135597]